MFTSSQISDAQILARIKLAQERAPGLVSCEWSGYMPPDAEAFDRLAEEKLDNLTVADVRFTLQNKIDAESVEETIDSAMGMACEPDDLPENAMVTIAL